MKLKLCPLLVLALLVATGRSDFVGPDHARFAASPDGNLLVRIKTVKDVGDAKGPTEHDVTFYQFDTAKNSYVVHSTFHLIAYLSQMLYVSNHGDLVLISLHEKDAMRLYSKDGKLEKSWNLADFLIASDIAGCAKTGATVQWLDEAEIRDRRFFWKGPSQVIRALPPPYTIMRGVDSKVTFSGSIDLKTHELTKRVPNES